MTSIINLIRCIIALLNRFPVFIFEFMMRIAVGAAFFRSGLVKIKSWDSTVGLFRDEYQVPLLPPQLAAYMAATCELTMPVLLLFGLASRFAALVLLGMTCVIQVFVYPENWPDHILWASILGYLAVRGPGKLSLDYLVARKFNQPQGRA